MFRRQGVIASSRPDTVGDVFSVGALEDMVEQYNKFYIPVIVEHDPRSRPIGRGHRAWLETREDGVVVVAVEFEFFEEGDTPERVRGDGRRVPQHRDGPGVVVSYDEAFGDKRREPAPDVRELAEILNASTQLAMKKSVDPITVLTLAGTFVAGGLASGLLGAIGTDAWALAKEKLRAIFEARKRPDQERILELKAHVESAHGPVVVHVLVVNPELPGTLEGCIESAFPLASRLLPELLAQQPDLASFTMEYRAGKSRVLFGVRRDAAPLHIDIRDGSGRVRKGSTAPKTRKKKKRRGG
jgi:hypothetical protein